MKKIKAERTTRGIVNCQCSAYSSSTARIKSSCNLIGNRFKMPNVSYTQPLAVIIKIKQLHKMENQLQSISRIFTEKIFRIPDYQRGYAWTEKHLKD